jgi:hypothetical protein
MSGMGVSCVDWRIRFAFKLISGRGYSGSRMSTTLTSQPKAPAKLRGMRRRHRMDRLIPGHDGGGVYANINKSKKNTIRLAALLHDGIADALAAGVDAA